MYVEDAKDRGRGYRVTRNANNEASKTVEYKIAQPFGAHSVLPIVDQKTKRLTKLALPQGQPEQGHTTMHPTYAEPRVLPSPSL